jgi:hypothetical protein
MKFFRAQTINGVRLPRRRFTAWAALYFAVFVCAPVLGLALLLDVALYLIFDQVFGRCYGVLCLLP